MSVRVVYDLAGNIEGYWDDEQKCWVPKPEIQVEENVDLTRLTKDQLREMLDIRGIAYRSSDNKDDLIRLFGPTA